MLVDGVDVRESAAVAARQMALVPQDPFLFTGTVARTSALGGRRRRDEEVEQAAASANAQEFITRCPMATDTGSGGGAQPVSRPAPAHLHCAGGSGRPADSCPGRGDGQRGHGDRDADPEALPRLLEGRTSVVIAHRLSTVRHADVIYVLDDGRIVERGTHEASCWRTAACMRTCTSGSSAGADDAACRRPACGGQPDAAAGTAPRRPGPERRRFNAQTPLERK